MSTEDLSLPLSIVAITPLPDRAVCVDALTAYGRPITTVVCWWQTTAAGIDAQLRASWALQIEADLDRAGALASIEAEMREPYEVDSPDLLADAG